MVILGGLEIVAAGYILNEINKDDKAKHRGKSEERRRRKKHEHRHDSQSRPSRPQGLMPPPHAQGPGGRPGSAPPPMYRPPGPPMQHPPMPVRPPQPQTWPAQARPPTQAEMGQWYGRPNPASSQPNLANPATYPPRPPGQGAPTGPGNMQHAPTMHFDMKTGKWQGNMLPAEMQPGAGNGGKRSLSNVGLDETQRSNSLPPQGAGQMQMVRHRGESYSSVSSTSSTDSDLAYGKAYKKRQPTRILSHERERPHELANTSRPMAMQPQSGAVELDWYATQKKPPAMAQVMMNREGRASTMPSQTQGQYSMSQPNLGVFEMDGTSASPRMQGRSPRLQPQVMELDSRDTERYRAYRPG